MNDKTEATRLADVLDDSLCPMCHQAAALLRRWPDGEPVAARCPDCIGSEYPGWRRGMRCVTCDGTATVTAPPAESDRIAERKWLDNECLDGGCQSLKWRERIAALEASLTERDRVIEQAREALEKSRRSEHNPFETDNQSEHYERLCAALRAIEEVQR